MDTTIAVLAVYIVARQVEDQVVMPLVIGRAVHLHPVVTIFAVLVGLSAWGVLGGLLAVPVAAALNVTLHELFPEETSTERSAPDREGGEPFGGRAEPFGGRAKPTTSPSEPEIAPPSSPASAS
jgi:predicted PurR-regulated permease PerM